ncbi:MAG: hypothetical protein RR744_08605 [Cellulosilyticaceae bacterium]
MKNKISETKENLTNIIKSMTKYSWLVFERMLLNLMTLANLLNPLQYYLRKVGI